MNSITDILELVDHVVVMTVEPGFSNQEFMPGMPEKVRQLDAEANISVSVDDGVDESNARECADGGADLLISGSTIFGANGPDSKINGLRTEANDT